MEPEPNRESTMDLTNDDVQIADMDESSSFRGDDEEGQKDESLPDSDHNSKLVQEGECRICFAPTEASGEDPILELGCRCKNELSYGHELCLTKWFVGRITTHGTSDCEICRSPLGTHLEVIVRNNFEEASHTEDEDFQVHEAQRFRPVRLLFQLPRKELDRLQVPLETPTFYDLPRETRHALVTSMNRHEEMYLRGGTRENANVIVMAYILAVIATEGPLSMDEMQARIGEAFEIRDRILGGSEELVDLFVEIFNDGVELADRFLESRDQRIVDGPMELVDLRRNDEEDTDTNADMDVSDEERILDLPPNVEEPLLHLDDDEPHMVEDDEERDTIASSEERDTIASSEERISLDLRPNDQEQILDSNDELQRVENDEEQDTGRSDEEGDMDDDDLELYAHWERHIIRLNGQYLMPSSDELENVLNEISAHVNFLAANRSGDMLYEMLPFMYRSRRNRTYGRFQTFFIHDIGRTALEGLPFWERLDRRGAARIG